VQVCTVELVLRDERNTGQLAFEPTLSLHNYVAHGVGADVDSEADARVLRWRYLRRRQVRARACGLVIDMCRSDERRS
jgi:hypothetical protein